MKPMVPPVASRRLTHAVHHGVERTDPYAWLRDPNWRDAMQDPQQLDTAIRAYLEAENTYADGLIAAVEPVRQALVKELRGRILEEDSSVPSPDGPWLYYTRFREGGQQPLLCRRPVKSPAGVDEQLLLDGDAEAEGSDYFRLGSAVHSPNHRYLAYAVDRAGAEAFVLRVRDLQTGKDLPEQIDEARGDIAWASDSAQFLYTRIDEEYRPRWVYRHCLGAPASDDRLVYTESDPGFFLSVEQSESGRFLLIDSHDHTTSEVHWLEAARPDMTPRVIAPRVRDVEYSVSDSGSDWLILTNADGAEDFCICRAPIGSSGREHWQTWIAHEPGRLIENMLVFERWLVREELTEATPRIVVRSLTSDAEHVIADEDACIEVGLLPGLEYATDTLRFMRSGFARPAEVYDYSMATRERVLRKQQVIPSGHQPAAYVSERIHACAADGETVPISLFYHRNHPPSPQSPLLLSVYGAYGMSELPGFSPNRLSLVDRGFVYAIAHVRGGRERGYRWYREGRARKKENTFSDTIACAEGLIAEGYTNAGRITLQGGSAGGMVVGAVINRRPELFYAAVADVPFVDCLNTMLDDTLPLTPPEWPEWGNPLEDATDYATIAAYSPYDNVKEQAYPTLLVTAGVSDPRVTYWEPAKWVARLRAESHSPHEILLRTNMSAGHGGAAGRFDYLEEVAYRYAFLLRAYQMRSSGTG